VDWPSEVGKKKGRDKMQYAISARKDLARIIGALVVLWGLCPVHELQAAPGSGVLFGTDASGGNLISVNPTTGAGAVIGSTEVGPVPSLATDPTTGILYAGGGGGFPAIYTVDPSSGAATFLGDTGLGVATVGAMDFAADGTLYAAVNIAGDGGTGSDHLAIIDTTTGVATVLGPFGICDGVTIPSDGSGSCTIEGIEAIAFDKAGKLWGALNARGAAGSRGLYRIDTLTGAATFVTPILNSSGAPPSGGIVSLQFACDGTLYGGTATKVGSATDGGKLVTINPTTGRFAFVGSVSATGGPSLGALAFADSCESEPPSCFLSAILPGPPTKIKVTTQDTGSGLASITPLIATNATVTIPPFTIGSTDPIVVTGTKIDQSKKAQVELAVKDVAGNVTTCDPVLTLLARENNKPTTETLTGIPEIESQITVFNGSPGMHVIVIKVNRFTYVLQGLRDKETRSLDVSAAMRRGHKNTVTLTGWGKRGATAEVIISE
jgi:hypothetical protein